MLWVRPSSLELKVFWNERVRPVRPDWRIERTERIGRDALFVIGRKRLLWGSFGEDDGLMALVLLFVDNGSPEDHFESSLASIFLLDVLGLARSPKEKESIARSLFLFRPAGMCEASYALPNGIRLKAGRFDQSFYALTVQFSIRTIQDYMV
ncbi:MAG: hypothetical protein IMX04_00870 [Candidatus Carbobacillus altaicus]|uniref:Uncharacterized protein n=1 Tax=Candidatus Carbonibacillus altaicus TaxID=2163959 RepID=A0A2R6XZD0_9BACL|nr:hypothetical protein [Candidatus Carbobacillus altaicus]PTQ55774.1 MAG: hypothetical protein BSOLF_1489 [Candidatus Carbobacillus altaicus]